MLNQTVKVPDHLTEIFKKYFGYANGIDLKIHRSPHEPVDFNRSQKQHGRKNEE